MKNSKKLLSLFLAIVTVVTCCSVFTISAFATTYKLGKDTYNYTIEKGQVVIQYAQVNSSSSTYTVPTKIKGKTVSTVNGVGVSKNVTKVVIPNSIKTLGAYAVYGDNIKVVSIGSGVTTLNESTFSGCQKIYYYSVSSANKYYKSYNGVILSKNGKTLVLYPSAKATAQYTLPSSVYAISNNAFTNAKIYGIKFNSKIKYIGEFAFSNSKLKTVTLPKTVTSLGYASFQDCSYLQSANLINSKIRKIDYRTFSGTSRLSSVSIPSTVTKLSFRNTFTSRSLKNVYISSYNKAYCSVDGVVYSKNKSSLIFYPVGRTNSYYKVDPKTTTIYNNAFERASKLKTVYLGSKVSSIGKSAFYRSGVTKINMPNNLTSIGSNAFYGTKITSVTLQKKVKYIGSYAFACCNNLKKVDMSKASLNAISRSTFERDKNLTSVTLPNKVKTIGASSFEKTGIESIEIPSSTQKIGPNAFAKCKSLKTVIVKSTNVKISKTAFPKGATIQ